MTEIRCPADHELVPLLAGEAVTMEVKSHFETCPQCQDRLSRMKDDVRELRSTITVAAEAPPPAVETRPALLSRPALIGKYPVVGALDAGGQARVYRALHPTLDKELVIKLSRKPLSAEGADRHVLVAEGKILAGLEHPNLARIYDLDFHDNLPFLVMEYVRSRNLKRYAEEERLTPRQAARLVADVARALAVVHRQGIIHQDIKPQNILVDEAGRPRLIDFGMARLRHAWDDGSEQPSGGTPPFMAPEQARGDIEHICTRSDLFGLGAVLYFLLTGKVPYPGKNVAEVLQHAGRCDFDRSALRAAGVPRRLENICLKAMAPKPADRYARAEDLAADLERFVGRPRFLALVTALAAVLLLTVIGVASLLNRAATPLPVSPAISELQVQVYRQDRYLDLNSAVPLHTAEDKIQIFCKIPRGYTGAMFLLSSKGRAERLAPTVSPGDSFTKLIYPAEGKRIGFQPATSGTELIVVCATATPNAPFGKVEALLAELGPLPPLPPYALLWIQRDEIKRGGEIPRTLAQPEADPLGAIETRLDRLRQDLREKFEVIQGVAFSHQP